MDLQLADFAIIHKIHQNDGSPWRYMYSHHPTTAQARKEVVDGRPEIAIFQPTHAGLKMAMSSPVGSYRGTDLKLLEIAPATVVIG